MKALLIISLCLIAQSALGSYQILCSSADGNFKFQYSTVNESLKIDPYTKLQINGYTRIRKGPDSTQDIEDSRLEWSNRVDIKLKQGPPFSNAYFYQNAKVTTFQGAYVIYDDVVICMTYEV